MSNTLLNYFKKADNKLQPKNDLSSSPAPTKKEPSLSSPKIDKENVKPKKEVKMEVEEGDDEEVVRPPATRSRPSESETNGKTNLKRKRLMVLSDSDSETEAKKKPPVSDSSPDIEPESDSDDFIDDEEMEEDVKPKLKKNSTAKNKNLSVGNVGSPKTPKGKSAAKSTVGTPGSATKVDLSSFAASTDTDNLVDGKFKHFSYEFLQEDKIKDLNGRLRSDPNYDPRTILVPESFRKTLTPGLRQWWDIKSRNFDVILFFKVGKFYELYHQDAVIAVKELGLTFMKGDYAHCGFPEISFSRFADALVSKGYKVGRVEQTETPEMMAQRIKSTKQDKTVRREVCRITTPGTKTFNMLDGEVTNAFSQYLFSFIEKVNTVQDKKVRTFGVCFVDTTVGKIHLGQFEDDRNCSKFRTTLAHYPPAHVLYVKNGISKEAKNIIDFQNGLKEGINNEKEMMSAGTLLKKLTESDYFKENQKDDFKWPEQFKEVLSEHDTLGLTPKTEYELAVNAMGGIVWCLKNCLIDKEILSMKNFEIYKPVDNILTQDVKKTEIKKTFVKQKYMVLDSISLTNLEVFENNYDNTQSGTLFEKLDFCNTAFGKRLLKYWLVNPLCDPESINDRLDAIEDLKKMEDKFSYIADQLKLLPDLERLISKIHQLGNVDKDHPESRAIMYENDTYSKKKVEDFITILNGFTIAEKLLNSLKEYCPKFKSKLLKTILTIIKADEASKKLGFPHLDELLKKYHTSFDAETAKKTGKIIPSEGLNVDYDEAINDIKETENELNKYLKSQIKQFNCTINYFGTSKNRYQLEIPENKCKNIPEDFELTSTKKGFKRYWTDEIKEMISRLTNAEDRREAALKDTMKCLFKNFDNHYNVWNRAVQCLSILDVLVSLTNYVRNECDMCRPEIVMLDESTDKRLPFIDIKNGRHPCIGKTYGGDFIPNDLVIGCEDSNNNWQSKPLVIVTGPNMGGKSTLMRQVGLIVILAQMGCFVPAESCRLSPVDRIFTRIGASDKILAGESTFFLELSETASILHHASKHSLVLMDELGRGTATFDGTAIAYSVVKELAQNVNCRTLFSTHYHHLVEEFSDKDNVSMGHMQCMVNDDNQSITFLYKFGEGACPKSHGFNAARLADVPEEIIKLGSVKSVEFENFSKKLQLLKKIMHIKSKNEMNDITEKFKELCKS